MFDDDVLIGKFSNIFIKLLVGIMSRDLKDIKHYLSDDVYNKYQNMINELITNNEIRCFDELNVKSISILSKEQDDNFDIVNVKLVSRYMDYIIDSNIKEYKSGVNNQRVELSHNLVFKKRIEVKERPISIKCPSCGANLDANKSGVCPYCGSIHSALSYDYVLYEVSNL